MDVRVIAQEGRSQGLAGGCYRAELGEKGLSALQRPCADLPRSPAT
jgi:hypothetical protein